MFSPRPVPFRAPLVEKPASKILGKISGRMPGPLSRTENTSSGAMLAKFSTLSSRSCGPSFNAVKSSGCRSTRASISTQCAFGEHWRAFTARLSSTWMTSVPFMRTATSWAREIERRPQHPGFDLDPVRFRRALEGIHRQIEQHLDDIGAVHAHGNVLGQRADGELVGQQARMDPDQMGQVHEHTTQ